MRPVPRFVSGAEASDAWFRWIGRSSGCFRAFGFGDMSSTWRGYRFFVPFGSRRAACEGYSDQHQPRETPHILSALQTGFGMCTPGPQTDEPHVTTRQAPRAYWKTIVSGWAVWGKIDQLAAAQPVLVVRSERKWCCWRSKPPERRRLALASIART